MAIITARDFYGNAQPMKVTNNGITNVPHHIVDEVSLVPVRSAAGLEADRLFSAAPCSLVELDVYVTVNGFIYLFDLAADPGAGGGTVGGFGASLTASVPLKIYPVVAGNLYSFSPAAPIQCANGLWAVFSTGAFGTIVEGADAWFSGIIAAQTGEAS